MAGLTRATQKQFGTTAGSNSFTAFGALASGYPSIPTQYDGSTITPALVQSLANFLTGWTGAVVAGNSPSIQDMNGLFFAIFYQLAYIFTRGVPAWDSGTTYNTNDIVVSGGVMYISLIDTNLNHAVTDTTKWFTPVQNGLLTPNALPVTTITLPANESMLWSNLIIGNGETVTVPSNANLIGVTKIQLTGTGTLIATGTGVIRVL